MVRVEVGCSWEGPLLEVPLYSVDCMQNHSMNVISHFQMKQHLELIKNAVN